MASRKSFLLRIDPTVYEAMQRWAADDLRSLNAQVEYVLRAALDQAGRLRQSSRGTSGAVEPEAVAGSGGAAGSGSGGAASAGEAGGRGVAAASGVAAGSERNLDE